MAHPDTGTLRLIGIVAPQTFTQAVHGAENCARATKRPFFVVIDADGPHFGDAEDLACYWPHLVVRYSTEHGALDSCPDCGDPVAEPGTCGACIEDQHMAPVAESVEG